jgi:serine/threonine-protein kinase RsbW
MAPDTVTFESEYPGTADQARHVRADLARVAGDCPVLDELVLLTSELATNAILHSRSGGPAGRFTVRATLCPGH